MKSSSVENVDQLIRMAISGSVVWFGPKFSRKPLKHFKQESGMI